MNCIKNEGYDTGVRASKAHGRSIKINGKWVMDTSMGCGTHILGHGFTSERIKKALDYGTLYGMPFEMADKCGWLLKKATGFDYFVFCNSGSEATMRAIRIARAYTGRDKIAFFEGCWHGTHDWNLAFYSAGIPKAVKDVILQLPFTEEAFEIIKREQPALVMVEPIQGVLPIDRRGFLKELRTVTEKEGVVLCFDEVISGFRASLGGAAELFSIYPDLVCYGKTVGGGHPVGVVGGNTIMLTRGVRYGGTFSANPITIVAAIAVLEYLLENNIYDELREITSLLANIKTNKAQILGVGNMYKLLFTKENVSSLRDKNIYEASKEVQMHLLSRLLAQGIYIGGNHCMLLSTLHTKDDVRFIRQCLESL